MKNLRHSRKALSPVVASIILIAVTVAVSIAVAAWMGALTTGFMATEELKITNAEFSDTNKVTVLVKNTGTTPVTISEAYINGKYSQHNTTDAIPANGQAFVEITYGDNFVDGASYQIKLVSSKGNPFVYTATAPTQSGGGD